MKTWKKLAILGVALSALLLLAIGGILASPKVQRITVYTGTPQHETTFTAHTGVAGWSWSIDMHQTGSATLSVYDMTTQQYFFEETRQQDDGGSINITDGHEYRVFTGYGTQQVPGVATCTVVNANWNPQGPQGP